MREWQGGCGSWGSEAEFFNGGSLGVSAANRPFGGVPPGRFRPRGGNRSLAGSLIDRLARSGSRTWAARSGEKGDCSCCEDEFDGFHRMISWLSGWMAMASITHGAARLTGRRAPARQKTDPFPPPRCLIEADTETISWICGRQPVASQMRTPRHPQRPLLQCPPTPSGPRVRPRPH